MFLCLEQGALMVHGSVHVEELKRRGRGGNHQTAFAACLGDLSHLPTPVGSAKLWQWRGWRSPKSKVHDLLSRFTGKETN
jgi:hypothetical protein